MSPSESGQAAREADEARASLLHTVCELVFV